MKQIPLKSIPLQVGEDTIQLSYKAQLAEILRTPSDARSADLDEVRRSLRILDALEKVEPDGVLDLEDADYEYMVRRVNGSRWPVIDKAIIQFVEDVTTIK